MKLADTQAIAVLLKRSPATVRWLAHTGRLARHGTDLHGRALYSIEQAEQLLAAEVDKRP